MGEDRRNVRGLLDGVIRRYPQHPRFLLPILQDVQRAERHLPVGVMRDVAEYLGIPDSKVYAVATFYGALSLTPRGETEIKVCMGTACHLRGAGAVLAALEKKLGVSSGETTPDGKFSIEAVNCLGACALAPVAMIGDEVRGGLTPEDSDRLIGGVL